MRSFPVTWAKGFGAPLVDEEGTLKGDTERLADDCWTGFANGFVDASVGFDAKGLKDAGVFVDVAVDGVAKGFAVVEGAVCPPKAGEPKTDPFVCVAKGLDVWFDCSKGDFWRAG